VTELIAQVSSVLQGVARQALAQRQLEELRGRDALAAVAEAGELLAAADLVPKREQAERLRLLLGRLKIAEGDAGALVELGRRFPPHLRAVVAEAVPLKLRPQLYNRTLAHSAPVELTPGEEVAPIAVPAAEPAPVIRGALPARESISRGTADGSGECTTVLLLSNRDRQDANVRTLVNAGLDPRIVESVEELETTLLQERGVCACVIDHSVLYTLEEAVQRSLIQRLGMYSTFLRVRIEESGLKISRDTVRQLLKAARALAAEVPQIALCFDSDGNIAPSEVEDFRAARDLLRSHDETRFILGELNGAQAHVLVAAARSHTITEGIGGPDDVIEVRTLTTRFLTGGKSGARLATVRVNEGGPTLVAKITNTEAALQEMRRFRRFIQPWDPALRSELHFHREDAVILTGLVSSGSNRTEPAEPLEERITSLWNDQWLVSKPREDLDLRTQYLARGLERAAQELSELNTQRAGATDAADAGPAAPLVANIALLESDNFRAGLGDDAVAAREAAWVRFQGLARAAVVHGDVHLRNMLVRGESEIHFVDFAGSGPGHPAEDLVRFEMALYAGPVRQFESDRECVAFQRALSVDRMSRDALEEQFPQFFQCHVNRACARGMVAARDHAIRLLYDYGGGPADYLATKYLVAWQYVGIIGMHTGLARAVIEALGDELLGD
jgi:hypothetical protein